MSWKADVSKPKTLGDRWRNSSITDGEIRGMKERTIYLAMLVVNIREDTIIYLNKEFLNMEYKKGRS